MSEVRESSIDVRRRARCFESGAPDARSAWLLLHGYGQLAADFLGACAPLARPERLLVAPEALSRFYLRSGRGPVGASWMTREAREGEIADYVEYLDQLVRRLVDRAPRSELVVLGFSQGVATAWRWTARARRRPDRLVAIGGGMPPDLDLAAAASRSANLRATLIAGEIDEAYTPSAADVEARTLERHAIACELITHPGGHETPAEVLRRL